MSYMPAGNLPVSIKTMVIKREGMTIYYPQVILMRDVGVQKKINQTIFQRVQYLIKQQHIQQDAEEFVEVIGTRSEERRVGKEGREREARDRDRREEKRQ